LAGTAQPVTLITGASSGIGAALAVEMPLGRWLILRFSWDAGVEIISIDGSLRTRPETRAAFAIGGRL